jgi:hypothetical protein
MLRNQRTHNPKQPAPKTRNPTRRPPYRRRKSFRRPSIQHRIKHALEEILHDVEADITGGAVDTTEQEDGNAHHGGGEDHGIFAADARDTVRCGAEQDANDAGEVDVDVGAVGVAEGEVKGAVFCGEDFWEEGAYS